MLTVICLNDSETHTLPRTLAAYEALEPPPGGWKLRVVNASPSGRVSAMLKSYASRLPLEIVSGPSQQSAAALIAALRSVEGDLAVLTDANSIPAPGWLSHLRAAADRRDGFAVFSGSILPAWDGGVGSSSVAWYEQGLIYALSEPRSDEGPIAAELVRAPNLAIRREAIACGLGPEARAFEVSPRLPAVEVESLVDVICTAGHRAWYVPQAAVRHVPGDWRFQADRVMCQALRRGRASAALECVRRAQDLGGFWGVLGAAARVLGKRQLGVWRARLSGDLQAALRARWRRNHALGRFIECQRQWRCGRP